jgi:uncharacterized protein (DUF1810 family)
MSDIDLARFVDGYERDFERALREIRAGHKETHWMWYIFPQVDGLGSSPMAMQYAIHTRAEAEAFLTHPPLGPDYCELVDAVWQHAIGTGVSLHALFGEPDKWKLVSSLTVFAAIARGLDPSPEREKLISQVDEVLDEAGAQGLPRCATTRARLSAWGVL